MYVVHWLYEPVCRWKSVPTIGDRNDGFCYSCPARCLGSQNAAALPWSSILLRFRFAIWIIARYPRLFDASHQVCSLKSYAHFYWNVAWSESHLNFFTKAALCHTLPFELRFFIHVCIYFFTVGMYRSCQYYESKLIKLKLSHFQWPPLFS